MTHDSTSLAARIAFVAILAGCASSENLPVGPGESGGQAGSLQGGAGPSGGAGQGGSSAGVGGVTASGGTATGGAAGTGAGGASDGGTSSAGTPAGGASAGSGGGVSGMSGAAGAGVPGGSGGTGGGGGAGGSGNTAGTGNAGGATAAVPSEGCAKMNPRPPNGTVTVTNERIYTFPASYDGRTPMPLMIGFHANGNPINQIQNLTNGSELETAFVRAFPKSAGSGWNYNTDITRVRAMWDDLLANYCVDTSRIFGTGHSSGAQMIVQMLCNGEMRFRGVAPVAASRYCTSHAAVAVMYIQGQMDAQRGNGNGSDVVQVFRTNNMCATTSVPKTDVAMCRSSFDSMQVNPGCITYDGCSVPTHWCSHNDNGYNATDGRQHGWPCFASSAMAAFFQGLR